MPKVHDMWVNSLAALLGALAAIRSVLLLLLLLLHVLLLLLLSLLYKRAGERTCRGATRTVHAIVVAARAAGDGVGGC